MWNRVRGRAMRWATAEIDQRRDGPALALHARVSDLTMLPVEYFVANVHVFGMAAEVPGALVECGTWRGGMSAAMAGTLPGRHSVLFDSFEGLPDAKDIDGPAALHWSRNERTYDNCTAEERWAHEAMHRVGQDDYEINKGWFDATVPAWAATATPIAVLRLDGDWYDSTMVCLDHLYPLVVPGGLVVIDDYYAWDGCARAVHDYLSKTQSADRISQRDPGVAFIVRKPV